MTQPRPSPAPPKPPPGPGRPALPRRRDPASSPPPSKPPACTTWSALPRSPPPPAPASWAGSPPAAATPRTPTTAPGPGSSTKPRHQGRRGRHTAWVRRARAHPRITEAMARRADGVLRRTCAAGPTGSPRTTATPPTRSWSRPRPRDGLRDWPCWPRRSPPAPAPPTTTRARVSRTGGRLETTFQGAGSCPVTSPRVRRAGRHRAGCPVGAPRRGDDRSHAQRYHDALAEAMHRLVSAGLLPERPGSPPRSWRISRWPT